MNLSKISELAKPIIESLGLELTEVTYQKSPVTNGFELTVYISKASGSITHDDCAAVSRALGGPLDELDPTGGASYNLTVSSSGTLKNKEKNND